MAYHRMNPPCDSYFVESDNAQYPSLAPQEYLKMIGRRKQEAMADELSRQASDAYIDEIMAHMKEMEVNQPWLPKNFVYADTLVGRDSPGRCLDKHPARNPVVHETVPH
jgi:hypothetical protein